jgi:hypothetical protein
VSVYLSVGIRIIAVAPSFPSLPLVTAIDPSCHPSNVVAFHTHNLNRFRYSGSPGNHNTRE